MLFTVLSNFFTGFDPFTKTIQVLVKVQFASMPHTEKWTMMTRTYSINHGCL